MEDKRTQDLANICVIYNALSLYKTKLDEVKMDVEKTRAGFFAFSPKLTEKTLHNRDIYESLFKNTLEIATANNIDVESFSRWFDAYHKYLEKNIKDLE